MRIKYATSVLWTPPRPLLSYSLMETVWNHQNTSNSFCQFLATFQKLFYPDIFFKHGVISGRHSKFFRVSQKNVRDESSSEFRSWQPVEQDDSIFEMKARYLTIVGTILSGKFLEKNWNSQDSNPWRLRMYAWRGTHSNEKKMLNSLSWRIFFWKSKVRFAKAFSETLNGCFSAISFSINQQT